MPALLATLHDLLVGLGIGLAFAIVTTGLAVLTGKWIKHSGEVELSRLPREPAEPVDFAEEIRVLDRSRRGPGPVAEDHTGKRKVGA